MRDPLQWVLACLLCMLALDARMAVAQIDTGVVEVLVVRDDGMPLGGVAVRATSTETGFTLDALTDDDGLARLPAVLPGMYEVRFTQPGLTPLVVQSLVVHVGQTVVLQATMQAALTETVVVVAAVPIVDVHRTDSSTNIVPLQIQALPVPDRDFQRLAFIAPSVQRERGEFRFAAGGPVIGGAGNASQSTILVDGVDLTDPALGLAITRFSQDAIREFRVIANRFDAEVGGSAGGALSVATRAGTNLLAGNAFAFFRDDALRARRVLERDKTPYGRQQFGAAVGGPLVRDRAHLFGSFEQINEDNIALFRPGGAYQPRAADVNVPVDQTLLLVRIDRQMPGGSRIAGKVVYERFRQENFRVGGVQDPSHGQRLDRDNWSVGGEHVWAGARRLNQLLFYIGRRRYDEPRNSTAVAEWFSNGNTLRTGGNILGDLFGEGTNYQLRNTLSLQRAAHEIKVGLALQYVRERSRIDIYQSGLFIYLTDTRALPLAYLFGTGSSDITTSTTRYAAFVHDTWSVRANLTVSAGLRYDLDTNGNNADVRHPFVPDGRKIDIDNIQPRAAFSWDVDGTGRTIFRGGAGQFTGRYLLVPAIGELQQNGVTGRVAQTRINGLLIGLPALALDPANPLRTGVPLPPDIGLIDRALNAPNSTQLSGGWTARLGSTGLFFDIESAYIRGRDEIIVRDTNFGGNARPIRLSPRYGQINTFTNEGRSEYKSLVASLNGTFGQGHLVTAAYTLASKKNTADDFSPEFPIGYPSDAADIAAEYGRSRSDERHRVTLSGVFRMPMDVTVAGIYEYGSGQPWTHRLGYDVNGDGKNSDRPARVPRFGEDGPPFRQLSVRITKRVRLPRTSVDVIGEAFNLLNTTNIDVTSIDGAEFLSGPTLSAPAAPIVRNPNFRTHRDTFPGRELQLGIRWAF